VSTQLAFLPPELSDRITYTDDGCMLWTGPTTPKGYALVPKSLTGEKYGHRAVWRLLRGPLPYARDTLDHTCGRTSCLNVEHLEPVSRAENSRRAARSRRVRSWSS